MSRLRPAELVAAPAAAAVAAAVVALPWADGRTALCTAPWIGGALLAEAALGASLVGAQAASDGPALPASLDTIAVAYGAGTTIATAVVLATSASPTGSGGWLALAGSAVLTGAAFRALRGERGWTPGPGREIEVVSLPAQDGSAAVG